MDQSDLTEHEDYLEVVAEAKRLRASNPDRMAMLTLATYLGASGAEAATLAGYSGGQAKPGTEEHRKAQSSNATRAKRSKKFRRLMSWFLAQRAGKESDVLASDEVLRMLSQEAREGSGTTKLRALQLLNEYHAKSPAQTVESVSMRHWIDELCRRDSLLLQTVGVSVGKELTSRGARGFADWNVPERLQRLANLLEATGDALDVFELCFKGKSHHDDRRGKDAGRDTSGARSRVTADDAQGGSSDRGASFDDERRIAAGAA